MPDQPSPARETQGAKRVMWIWHAAVVAEYQKTLSALADYPDLDMTLLIPRRWPERAGQMVRAEEPARRNFRLIKARTVFTGLYYVYFFPSFLYYLLRYQPNIIYCYEEAHSFLAACTLFIRRLLFPRTRVLLYAAQNIVKRYPIPFRWFERYCFRHADMILACGATVAQTLRTKGYGGPLQVVPLPVDACAYIPDPALRTAGRGRLGLPSGAVVVGYAGKLVEEKGLRTLVSAFRVVAREQPDAHLLLLGGGPLRQEIEQTAQEAGLSGRVHIPGVAHNADLPMFMNALDVFVLPSETRRNWREQFGRVIVEAMSCGVPVIGSDSGEIPQVVGDAGLIFREGDVHGLADCLRRLLQDPDLRALLAERGRRRVLDLYSVEQVAERHHAVYQEARAEAVVPSPESRAPSPGS